MRISRWDEAAQGALSEEAARKRYSPALYQVLLRRVAEPARMTGNAPQRTLIALEGTWLLEADGRRAVVRPGDVVDLSAGAFVFLAEGPVTYLAVYPLPPDRVLN